MFLLHTLIVAKYTREAGVRTLERKIGAICRAVAVLVAETQLKAKATAEGVNDSTKMNDEDADDEDDDMTVHHGTQLVDKASLVATSEAAITQPPEMPIVIDPHAVKDILGVKSLCTSEPIVTLYRHNLRTAIVVCFKTTTFY